MSEEKTPSTYSAWPAIIQSVQTPLGFFALLVLVLSAFLGVLAYRAEPSQISWGMAAVIILLFFLSAVVVALAVFRPEALKGLRSKPVLAATDQPMAEQNIKIQQIANETSVQQDFIDPKLVRFIPPLNPTQFKIVRFPDETPPNYFKYPYVPTGKLIIYQIPFFLLPVTDSDKAALGHAVIDLQPGILNEPSSKNIEVSVNAAKNIHLLISAGHGLRMDGTIEFLYKRIGYLRLIFKDGVEQRTDLILGKHLREWAFGNSTNLVTELDLSWSKPAWLSHDSTKRFDLLTIPISKYPKNLMAIEIIAEFEEEHANKPFKTPSIIVSAMTVERAVS
jgi:hypothetical protein